MNSTHRPSPTGNEDDLTPELRKLYADRRVFFRVALCGMILSALDR